MSGTDIVYADILLRECYAMSSTDPAYRVSRLDKMANKIAYVRQLKALRLITTPAGDGGGNQQQQQQQMQGATPFPPRSSSLILHPDYHPYFIVV
eukprot:996778-Rhodomonas_salina.1